ncbi:uncharacterized protein PITG_21820 [Phytophthora infestans T30-4]|uniref:Uncharacterized protein n=1 Tax=Phytophthora infestans (strain T30-4) TaxID=403677 RepID=D0P4I5_PHYIT|nr:uncharacterized protein PITG_21820 [Phytophthora infestans T30-4]EEY66671.1 conserved hypothetical protein [Phytophthora infestans T30-4]|eukprot:XP_002894789.1 conserved hypothetical protein [Phytophthora infestans T30-4]
MSSRASGGSRSAVPPRKRAKRVDRKETAYIRVYGSEWQQSEGIVIQFLQQGLSEREIRAVIPVGSSRIVRLRKVLEEGVETLHTRREPQRPWHALSDDDIAVLKKHCETWILEDGFPCAHRRPRHYSRFLQYVHYFYPAT